MVKVLIKKDLSVVQLNYNKFGSPSDKYYYYVFYTSKANEEGDYLIFTNPTHYGETRLICKSKNKDEIIKIAENINNSIRLLSGYYDDNIQYKDKRFPVTISK